MAAHNLVKSFFSKMTEKQMFNFHMKKSSFLSWHQWELEKEIFEASEKSLENSLKSFFFSSIFFISLILLWWKFYYSERFEVKIIKKLFYYRENIKNVNWKLQNFLKKFKLFLTVWKMQVRFLKIFQIFLET